ncbi:MAG TPA: sulfotransferase [Gammaproteobacteria bacterium]|nr:sulfotransferase [Gammaproteobacteria bacterium]
MNSKAEEKEREAEFKRNLQLEGLLSLLNGALGGAEKKLLETASSFGPDYPLIFLMGPLRSGTTLFMQWLARCGIVAYPTNLLSRFYGAPVTGAHIQLMLTDPRYNFRNEILDFNSQISFESENGKTIGALAPNEFWYFWRRFLPFKELDWLPDEELFRVVDQARLVSELTTLTRVFKKPFALKSMILNYNIPFLNTIFSKALFVQIKRDPVTNVASILEARKRQLGSENEWYSFKIPEYLQLKDLDPINQSVGQLLSINKALKKGMESVDESRKMVVQYEEFCQNPRQVFDELVTKIDLFNLNYRYCGPDFFRISRNPDEKDKSEIGKAITRYYDEG